MDLDEAYLDKYYNVSREELKSIKDHTPSDLIDFKLRSMHMDREREKIDGKPALNPGPLLQVLSISVHPKAKAKAKAKAKPLTIYGSIIAENEDYVYGRKLKHDLYKREFTDPEIINTSGTLSLIGPDYTCYSDDAFIPMLKIRITMKLFDGGKRVFARDIFTLDDTEIEDGYKVKSVNLSCKGGDVSVKYLAIPFGVNGRIGVMFEFDDKDTGEKREKHKFINVNGEVVATCGGNSEGSEGCFLFQKQSNAFETVEIDGDEMQLSRCWVAVPAYSSLVLRLNLSDDSRRKLVNDVVTILPKQGSSFGNLLKLDGGLLIRVCVYWFPPFPLKPHKGKDVLKCLPKIPKEGLEEMDIDEDDETSSSHSMLGYVTSSSHRLLKPHKKKPLPSPAFEIYSVFIGREKSNGSAMQIHGSIEVLSDSQNICYILKRDESEAFALSQNMNFMPILNGSRVYEECNDLQMKIDLKDVDSGLAIKGVEFFGDEVLQGTRYRDKQLCSLIQGIGGFAAVHYSIFDYAVGANINVNILNIKMGGCPMIYGSIFSGYRNYYYSSGYHKNCYRSALFVRNEGNPVELNVEGSIPLSRSFVVVPEYSPLVINVDLSSSVSGHKLSSCTEEIEIEIGDAHKTIETSDYIIRIEVGWCEVK